MSDDHQRAREATCPRCGNRELRRMYSKLHPRTSEPIAQVMCSERTCQEILGVMPLSLCQAPASALRPRG
ncbi:MAG: hypothetical protein GAK45_00695 [Pseudomonas citronellolis]|nr:MAG: hypothetical protein GAK45_00695 [Pseudomonas citronellolis]